MKTLVTACDLALVSTQETDDDLDSVTPWMKTLLRYQTKAAFVFNKVKPRTNMFMEAKNRLVGMGYPVCPVEVPDYTDIATAGNMGIGILELRASKGGEHMRGVWGFVRSTAGL